MQEKHTTRPWMRRMQPYYNADGTLACGNDECRRLQEETWPALRAQGQAWETMKRFECSVCTQHRDERARLLGEEDQRAHAQEFVNAMYVHPNNEPKYYANQTRAIEFAKRQKEAILWVEAKDKQRAGEIMIRMTMTNLQRANAPDKHAPSLFRRLRQHV